MKDKLKDHAAKVKKNKLKHPFRLKMLWFSSDEKNFYEDQIVN